MGGGDGMRSNRSNYYIKIKNKSYLCGLTLPPSEMRETSIENQLALGSSGISIRESRLCTSVSRDQHGFGFRN